MSPLSAAQCFAEPKDAMSYLEWVLEESVHRGASDIHYERSESSLFVRIRVAGVMHSLPAPARGWALPVLATLKLLADLDSTEVRVPQEGVIRKILCGRRVEFRVSVLPTQYGESVVLRVLDAHAEHWSLKHLNMPTDVYASIEALAEKKYGLFVVTGPTGSGKTTTLYSILRSMDEEHRKLITVEDPIECVIAGATQVAVRHDLGLNFARCIRSFLRHDPDVIMVGEIRDPETAQVAVQASLTGHMVLTTLHASNTIAVPNRLIDLGVDPHLVAASLIGVLAQRLVRTRCPACSGSAQSCARCGDSGYDGRSGLFEYLAVDDIIRCLIIDCVPSAHIRSAATNMVSLRDAGERLVEAGITTRQEIARVLG